jgi:hypothetical protein
MSSFCSHCGSALGWAITPIRAAAPEPPAPGVDLDPVLAKFYAVDNVPALIAAQSEHIEKLQDAARRNVKPWEDTFPPTLLPKYLRDNGLPDPVPPTVVVVQTAKFCPACGEATGNPDCFICAATPPAPSAGVSVSEVTPAEIMAACNTIYPQFDHYSGDTRADIRRDVENALTAFLDGRAAAQVRANDSGVG